jgi:C4-dicarboxylate transporter DctM subunit
VTAPLLTVAILLFGFLGSGFWIAFSLMATAGIGMELFTNLPIEKVFAQALWNSLNSWSLAALPMFIFLGEMILQTRMSKLLFEGLTPWVQFIPGRLLHTNVVGSAIFAAVSGSSPATAATIGKITLAQLKAKNYDRSLSYGSLAGAGTLGLLIPPSIVLIVYGVLAEVSIGQLFVAGIVPGILLAMLFSGYIIVRVILNPRLGPDDPQTFTWSERIRALGKLFPVAFLILFILGSIYLGFATPSEAAAIGVVSSIIIAWFLGDLSWDNFLKAMRGTLNTSAMICFIIAGASFLSVAMGYLRLPATIAQAIGAMGLSPYMLIVILSIFYLVLGFFLDGISIIVMTLPISLPLIVQAGFSPLWFGIFITVLIEAGQITPPVGFNLFVIQGLTGEPIERVALAALPFFLLLLVTVVLITAFPIIITWLPSFM